jgi:3-oxoacyl-(acyl-carrier-protein) synthase
MKRVVVTGMGMVTPLACGVEPTWQRLLKGESGARKIERFEVSDLPCKIACIIPRGDGSNGTYNADQWMEPKEQPGPASAALKALPTLRSRCTKEARAGFRRSSFPVASSISLPDSFRSNSA